jgi:hypothetical protein
VEVVIFGIWVRSCNFAFWVGVVGSGRFWVGASGLLIQASVAWGGWGLERDWWDVVEGEGKTFLTLCVIRNLGLGQLSPGRQTTRPGIRSVSHFFRGNSADQPHEPPKFLARGVTLLLSDDNPGVKSLFRHPSLMEDTIIRHVERVQHAPRCCGSREMILIVAIDHFGFRRGQNVHVPGSQAEDERFAHGVLVEIQAGLAHRPLGSFAN